MTAPSTPVNIPIQQYLPTSNQPMVDTGTGLVTPAWYTFLQIMTAQVLPILGTLEQISIGAQTGANGTSLNVGFSDSPTFKGDVTVLGNGSYQGTSALQVPSGSTLLRPSAPVFGDIRYNTDLNALEFWQGSQWVQQTGTGGTVNQINTGQGLLGGPITNAGTVSSTTGTVISSLLCYWTNAYSLACPVVSDGTAIAQNAWLFPKPDLIVGPQSATYTANGYAPISTTSTLQVTYCLNISCDAGLNNIASGNVYFLGGFPGGLGVGWSSEYPQSSTSDNRTLVEAFINTPVINQIYNLNYTATIQQGLGVGYSGVTFMPLIGQTGSSSTSNIYLNRLTTDTDIGLTPRLLSTMLIQEIAG